MRRLQQVIAGLQPASRLLIGAGLGLAVLAVGLGTWYLVGDRGLAAVDGGPPASIAGHPGASDSAAPTPSPGSSDGPPVGTRFGIVPAVTPDAGQQALIDEGWTFLPVPAGGYSTVVPASWVAAALPRTLDPEELDTRAFDEIGEEHAAYADVLRSVADDLRSGALDAYGLDATWPARRPIRGVRTDHPTRWFDTPRLAARRRRRLRPHVSRSRYRHLLARRARARHVHRRDRSVGREW